MTATDTVRDQVHQLVRTVMDETPSADPAVVAAALLDRLTERQRREMLVMTLPGFVRREMQRYGWKLRIAAKTPSTSADRIRHWYSQVLSASLFIGDEWKFLSDCTAEDLHTAAADRYRKATEVHAEGDRWTKLALFMEENDRETVAQINEDELKSLMGQAT